MGKQLELFPPAPPTKDELLNAAQAADRRARALRESTRPGARVYARRGRHAYSRFDPEAFAGPELDE